MASGSQNMTTYKSNVLSPKLNNVSLSNFTDDSDLIYGYYGGGNSIGDKPTGVDAFGVLSFKTATGWHGQLLMSSNDSTGLYWRTATSLSGGWRKILDSGNYTDWCDPRYVNVTGDTMVGTGTATTEQWVTLKMGNDTPSGTAGNYTGQIWLYSNTAYSNQLRGGRALTKSVGTYLPDYAGTQYLVCVDTSDAVGGANQPLRCDSSGRLYECNSFVPTTGGAFSGDIRVQKDSGTIGIIAENTTSSLYTMLHINSAGTNHGVYSNGWYDGSTFHDSGSWLVYRDNTGTIRLNGSALSVSWQSTANCTAANNGGTNVDRVCLRTNDSGGNGVMWLRTYIYGTGDNAGDILGQLLVRNYKTASGEWGDWGGITIRAKKDGTFTYTVSNAANFRSAISAPSTTGSGASGSWGISVTGSSASCTGNAATATKWANARTISLTGSVTGSVSIDGSGDVSLATTTNHDHTHIVSHASFAKGTKPSSTTYLLGSWGCETGSGTATKNRFFGIEGNINTSGRSVMYMMAYQNTANSTASNTFSVWMDQDGTRGYSVSDAAAFRSAIGAGTSSLTIGTTATTAAAGNHNHDGDYVNVDGDTMTGNLNSCGVLPATTSTSTSTGYDLGSNTKRYRAIYVNQGIFVGPQGYTSSSTAYNGSTMGSSTFHSTRTTAGGGYYVRDADVVVGRYWYQVEGTTSVEGKATIQLGNDVATGTDKNASGRIRLFGSNTGYTDIDAKYGSVAGDTNKTYLNVGSHIYVNGSIDANNVHSREGMTITSNASSGNCAIWFANAAGTTSYWKMAVKTDNSQFIFYRVDNGTLTSKFWINSNGTTGTSSSRKIKHNIQNINFDTGYIIDRMQPVSYIVNGDLTNKTTYGFIYEDLIQVLPNVCDSAGETTGITYTAIIPVLTKEIQNLRKRLAAVENELNSYRSKT